MTDKILTIGIPSYHRPNAVATLVVSLLEKNLDQQVDIIVIDDGPDQETAALLAPHTKRIRFISHLHNKGYARSFLELFDLTNTKYLMLSADDDLCQSEDILRTVDLLKSLDLDFGSTIFLDTQGTRIRGHKALSPIALTDIRKASGHAPGLVYRVSAAMPHLSVLSNWLAKNCYASKLYPQTVLVYLMALHKGKCLWLPTSPIREGIAHDSALTDSDGTAYDSVIGRIREQLAFSDMFSRIELGPEAIQAEEARKALHKLHDQNAYRRITRELRRKHPEMVIDWVSGSLFFNRRSLGRHLINLLSWYKKRRHALSVLARLDKNHATPNKDNPK